MSYEIDLCTYCSFIENDHIFERVIEVACIISGMLKKCSMLKFSLQIREGV